MKKLILILIIQAIVLNDIPASGAASGTDSVVYVTEHDINYRERTGETLTEYMKEQCRLDVYHPKNEKGFATVVWFHGGGLTAGKRYLPEQLKNQGIAVVPVSYRLYPKIKCPDYIDDAAAAVAWVFKHIEEYGGDPDKIFVSGHSAGGYLTSMVGLDKRWLDKYGIDANDIAGLIPFSGHTITHFTVRRERGIPGTQPVVDNLAPLYHVRPDAPPLVLITGDRNLEMLGRHEENAYMWRMMKVVGHKDTFLYEMEGFNHGGMAAPAFLLLLKHLREITNDEI
jgi:acetyl esterase/lipase